MSEQLRLVAPRTVTIDVRGTPRPQGSLQAFKGKHGGIATKYAQTVWDWRHQVQAAVMEKISGDPFDGPCELRLGFELVRPASHYLPANSRRAVPVVRPNAASWPHTAPDLDKLVRAIGDACTDAGLWRDDGQVVSLHAAKRWATGLPGVLITVSEV